MLGDLFQVLYCSLLEGLWGGYLLCQLIEQVPTELVQFLLCYKSVEGDCRPVEHYAGDTVVNQCAIVNIDVIACCFPPLVAQLPPVDHLLFT